MHGGGDSSEPSRFAISSLRFDMITSRQIVRGVLGRPQRCGQGCKTGSGSSRRLYAGIRVPFAYRIPCECCVRPQSSLHPTLGSSRAAALSCPVRADCASPILFELGLLTRPDSPIDSVPGPPPPTMRSQSMSTMLCISHCLT